MGFTKSSSLLATAFLAIAVAALPQAPEANVTGSNAITTAPSRVSHPFDYLPVEEMAKHEVILTTGISWEKLNATLPRAAGSSHSKRSSTPIQCYYDPTYVVGSSIWYYYAKNFCNSVYPDGNTYPDPTSGIRGVVTLNAAGNQAFVINFYMVGSSGSTTTQARCYSDLKSIIDYGADTWNCGGYTGQKTADHAGSWAGGDNYNQGSDMTYYMWVTPN